MLTDYITLAPQYRSMMSTGRESAEGRDRHSSVDPGESKDLASKCRGKRELQSIEIETFENEDGDAGPWVILNHSTK